ncbi:hypothetical protein DM02DRAFT_615964 [Periconia macrospinosa]|uniref:Uncharacterized protein n=1 Tax=Periconia macrospinosa TaxID=97972 RepID=A0A2V1DJ04_9PLEO|nr:hypothetical protein DM02DRAFT_615964 [Periconia macrospinosa]
MKAPNKSTITARDQSPQPRAAEAVETEHGQILTPSKAESASTTKTLVVLDFSRRNRRRVGITRSNETDAYTGYMIALYFSFVFDEFFFLLSLDCFLWIAMV